MYNYLSKYEGRIRTKKEFSKTFVHLDDFTNFFQPDLKSVENKVENQAENAGFQFPENLNEGFKKLETQYQIILQKSEDLTKVNSNLQEQLSRYGILLMEEKNEKKEILANYQNVQTEFNQKVESLLREKGGIERRYYLL